MDFFQKMERKFGRYAINNITLYLVVGCIIGFFLESSPLIKFLNFDVYSILHGQIWRLFTWVLLPAPTGSGVGNMMLSAIFLLCLIPMGRQLEMALGTFKVNVFIIGGILLSDIGGILIYFIFGGVSIYLTTYYILLSIFMALAICFPDAQVNLYFLIPIKMKWILFLYIADMLYNLFVLSQYGMLVLLTRGAVIILAIINFFLFFWLVARKGPSMAQKQRQRAYKTNATPMRGSGPVTKHKCAVCGKTELDDPNLEFRFCSKCDGNYEYCQDHLFTHQHIKR